MDGVNVMSSWLTFNNAGVLMTFIGTGLTFWQAWKAKGYRDEIKNERARLTLHDLIPRTKSIKGKCKKITTPVDINNPPRGVKQQDVIDEVEGFCEYLEENNHRLNSVVDITEYINKIREEVQRYKSNQQPLNRYPIADVIYNNINAISIALVKAQDG